MLRTTYIPSVQQKMIHVLSMSPYWARQYEPTNAIGRECKRAIIFSQYVYTGKETKFLEFCNMMFTMITNSKLVEKIDLLDEPICIIKMMLMQMHPGKDYIEKCDFRDDNIECWNIILTHLANLKNFLSD